MAFHHVLKPAESAFDDPFTKSQLQKWGLLPGMRYHVFRYTKYYHKLAGTELVTDLLRDECARSVLQIMPSKGSGWQPLPENIVRVQLEQVPVTATRMDLFDRLADPYGEVCPDPPIARPTTGEIVRRMDDIRDGVTVCDNLREMLVCEDSANADLYSPPERGELLLRVFRAVVLGGPCCQYEDKLEVYLQGAKRLYKELVAVQKSSTGNSIEVASTAFSVTGLVTDAGEEVRLFPSSPNSFLYVTVDPLRHLVRVWYHAFVPFW